MICYTIEVFERAECIDEIVIVRADSEEKEFRKILQENNYQKISQVIVGGETRQDSSRLGVESAEDADVVVVHDGARTFITEELITKSVKLAQAGVSNIVSVPIKDTIKRVGDDKIIQETVDRSKLWAAQTPQSFPREVMLEAHQDAYKNNYIGTDEASLLERIGKEVKIVEGSYNNIKITTQEDLLLAKLIIKKNNL